MFLPTQQALPGGMGCYGCGLAGLGCPGCGGKCGMGSFDFSSFTWEDWLVIGVIGAALYSVRPGAVGDSVRRGKGRVRRAKKKASSALSTVGLLAGLGVLGYVGYQVWNGGTALGAQLAGSGA